MEDKCPYCDAPKCTCEACQNVEEGYLITNYLCGTEVYADGTDFQSWSCKQLVLLRQKLREVSDGT